MHYVMLVHEQLYRQILDMDVQPRRRVKQGEWNEEYGFREPTDAQVRWVYCLAVAVPVALYFFGDSAMIVIRSWPPFEQGVAATVLTIGFYRFLRIMNQ